MNTIWTVHPTKQKPMTKLKRYVIGGMVGMCFEYAYQANSNVWYIPLILGILMSVVVVIDVFNMRKNTG